MPSIQLEDNLYHYRCYERGKCIDHKTTNNEDEALFWILDSYIWAYSHDYELHNRVRYVDSRRLAFETGQKLYSYIGEPYQSMNKNKICSILDKAPFDDNRLLVLDLIDDFEDISQKLYNHSKMSLEDLSLCSHGIGYFMEKPYRNKYGGIANINIAFKEMYTKFMEIFNTLKQSELSTKLQEIVNEMELMQTIAVSAKPIDN